MGSSDLDNQILEALDSLSRSNADGPHTFSPGKYISQFEASAVEKAKQVLALLDGEDNPFMGLRPVFVSVGGGDGAELKYLVTNSRATDGFLIETLHPLADAARGRFASVADGKSLEVFEGDAQEKIKGVILRAADFVRSRGADYVAVTCHAVIHELYDRGKERFDSLVFFASIFSDDTIPTWFTYREPGVQEKWPYRVLLRARCSPKSLLKLADAILQRHGALRGLSPQPQVVGDEILVHRDLAIEILAKLFYLPDLEHEIQERYTSVNHSQLTNDLWLAIGETARRNGAANIVSSSAPTKSFAALWTGQGVAVRGLDEENHTTELSIPEAQTRIVAWRESAAYDPHMAFDTDGHQLEDTSIVQGASPGLLVAAAALEQSDVDLLVGILVSKGRSWIESNERDAAMRLLNAAKGRFPPGHFVHLWCHYLLSLCALFAGQEVSVEMFSAASQAAAADVGLGPLFLAERMEFSRKVGDVEAAAALAADLASSLRDSAEHDKGSLGGYVYGTAHFLMANLLRSGGLYRLAWDRLDSARGYLRPGIESHDTELAHCYYARGVCSAMTGMSEFDAPFDVGTGSTRRFASALIRLSYSHAAWFSENVARSQIYVRDAERAFTGIGAPRYAARARELGTLLQGWDDLERTGRWSIVSGSKTVAAAVVLAGLNRKEVLPPDLLARFRPSIAIGLLQFAKQFSPDWERQLEVRLPPILDATGGSLAWRLPGAAQSLRDADERLRSLLGISVDRRIPLLAD